MSLGPVDARARRRARLPLLERADRLRQAGGPAAAVGQYDGLPEAVPSGGRGVGDGRTADQDDTAVTKGIAGDPAEVCAQVVPTARQVVGEDVRRAGGQPRSRSPVRSYRAGRSSGSREKTPSPAWHRRFAERPDRPAAVHRLVRVHAHSTFPRCSGGPWGSSTLMKLRSIARR